METGALPADQAEHNGTAPAADDPAAGGWRQDKQGRWITGAKGRSGVVYRKGNETVEEAVARDAKAQATDEKPRSKKSAVPKAPAPTQQTIKELEFALTELLRAPEMITAARGEEWATEHFHREAPVLARNLAKAAEHNPWLRSKLEALLSGEELMIVKLLALIPVCSALVAYSLPPIIFYFDPPFITPQAREMFRVPHREKTEEAPDAGAPPAAPAAAETPQPVAA